MGRCWKRRPATTPSERRREPGSIVGRVVKTGVSRKRCSRCKRRPRAPGNHSWCRGCRNRYSTVNRRSYAEYTADERRRDSAKSQANVYLSRGLLKREPCRICGSANSQKHHHDYSKPLDVVWLCRWCHDTAHLAEAFAGEACALCGTRHPRALRQHQFADRAVVLCANHAALAGRRDLTWRRFRDEAKRTSLRAFDVKRYIRNDRVAQRFK